MLSISWGLDTRRAKLVTKQLDDLSLVSIQYSPVNVAHSDNDCSDMQAFGIKFLSGSRILQAASEISSIR